MARRPTSGRSRATAASRGPAAAEGSRSSRSSTGSSRGGRATYRPKSGASRAPLIMGLIGLLAVVGIGAFLMSGDSKGDAPPAEVADAPPLGARPAPPDDTDEVPSRSRDKGKKYDIEQLQALKGQIDLSIWSNIESLMAEAMPLYDEALAAREQGREKDFKAKMREALKKWREADGISEDWIYTIDALDDNLWEVLFKKESAKLLRWTKTFRGYTGLENG